MKKCILIDGSGLIYRGFYAIPPFLKSPAGVQTNAVYGFTNILLSLLAHKKPDYMAVAFDRKGPTFRHKEFTAYKATRVAAPQALYDQIPLVKKVVETFGIPSFESEGFEADDVLATIVKKLAKDPTVEIFIVTGDFDLFQMVKLRVSILYPAKGFKAEEIMKASDIKAKYGISPDQIPDFKGIAGDSSDNIPGVRGIGEKGAKELLSRFDSLENIYEHIDEITGAMRIKLEEGRDAAFMSKKLATLHEEVPINFDLPACRVAEFNAVAAKKLFDELGFKSIQKRLDEIFGIEPAQKSLFG